MINIMQKRRNYSKEAVIDKKFGSYRLEERNSILTPFQTNQILQDKIDLHPNM